VTALPPLETRQVKGMLAARYEANRTCSHPECVEPVPDRGHHIFPRSQIGNGNYFVQAWDSDGKEMFAHPIPHVTGLCRAHHDAVERHDAWIKYEDGSFVWYDRMLYQCRDCLVGDGLNGVPKELASRCSDCQEDWTLLGPLDPQPAGREKVRKPKRPRKKGAERRSRTTISLKVPKDAQENGGEVWDDLFGRGDEYDEPYGRVRVRLKELGLDGDRSPYYLIVDVVNDWLNG
jgi:hypothetical protein